jgi:hypothetical protein
MPKLIVPAGHAYLGQLSVSIEMFCFNGWNLEAYQIHLALFSKSDMHQSSVIMVF